MAVVFEPQQCGEFLRKKTSRLTMKTLRFGGSSESLHGDALTMINYDHGDGKLFPTYMT